MMTPSVVAVARGTQMVGYRGLLIRDYGAKPIQ